MMIVNTLLVLVLLAVGFKFRVTVLAEYRYLFLFSSLISIASAFLLYFLTDLNNLPVVINIILVNLLLILWSGVYFANVAKKSIENHKIHFSDNKIEPFSMDTKYIDLTYLKSIGSGSDEFLADIINDFIENIPHSVASIKMHIANNEWQEAENIAHRIKPTLNIFGIDREAEMLHTIEMDLQQNKFNNVNALIETVNQTVSLACDELKMILHNLRR